MLNLDQKDRKLLYYLSQNARFSQTQLSRKIGLSKNAVKYRIARLQKEGIIQKFSSIINIGAVSLDTFTLLLRFNQDIYTNPEMMEFFKNHPFANWAASLAGQWDLFIEFVYQDLSQGHKIIQEILSRFGDSIREYKITFSYEALRVEHFLPEISAGIKVEEITSSARTTERFKIDQTDAKILTLLNQNSSQPLLKIVQQSGLSIDIIRYRIKQLLKKKIIIKFSAEISLPKLGYTEYLYTLHFQNCSPHRLAQLKKSISLNQKVTYAFIDTFTSSLVFVCAFKDPQEIDFLSRKIRTEYPEMIKEQEYFIIKENILFNLFPSGLQNFFN